MLMCGLTALAYAGCGDEPTSQPVQNDADASNRTDGAGTPTCVFPAPKDAPIDACPTGCLRITGRVLDQANTCVKTHLVGCFTCPSGCGGPELGTCHKFEDGRAMMVADYAVQGDARWTNCTDTEKEQLGLSSPCP